MENNAKLDFATLALKGRRYQEAENIYMELATNNNSSEAWLGIGVCKLYQLTEGKTMDEVIFCFNKARNISPELTTELNNQLIMHTMVVLKTYAQIIEAAAIKHQAAKKAAQTGALIAGLSIVAGMNSNKAFSTVASLAGTGAGVGVAVGSLNAMSDYNTLIKHVLNKCNEAFIGVSSLVNKESAEYQQFDNNVKSIISYVEGALKSVSSNSSSRKKSTGFMKYLMLNASSTDKFKLMQAYFGVHKFKEGNSIMGVIYLCTLGGCGVLAYLDSVKMLNDEYVGHNLLN